MAHSIQGKPVHDNWYLGADQDLMALGHRLEDERQKLFGNRGGAAGAREAHWTMGQLNDLSMIYGVLHDLVAVVRKLETGK